MPCQARREGQTKVVAPAVGPRLTSPGRAVRRDIGPRIPSIRIDDKPRGSTASRPLAHPARTRTGAAEAPSAVTVARGKGIVWLDVELGRAPSNSRPLRL